MDKERIDGFRSAFAPGETLFWQVPAAARERVAFYSENLPRLFFEKITAVFAVSDHYALEFMRFLQEQGIRVPEDVQIIGFDDTLASRESVPALTTIHQDAALRARTAIRRVRAGHFRIVAFSYLPMAVSTVLSAWLRCKEHAAVPFWASFGAVAANTGLNYLLIFGKLGAPAMGVTGAAIATLVSQLLNLLLILIGFAVCLQKEAEHPLTVEIWTRWAGVLCLFSEYNGEPDLLFRLAQVKSAAIGDGHAQLIERTGGKFRYSLAVLVCDRPQCRIDLCQLAVHAIGVEGQTGGAAGQVIHAESYRGVGMYVADGHSVAPACNGAFAAVLRKLFLREDISCCLIKIDLAVGHFGQINKPVLQTK